MSERFIKHELDGDVRMVRFVQLEGDGVLLRLKATPRIIQLMTELIAAEDLLIVKTHTTDAMDDKANPADLKYYWQHDYAVETYGELSIKTVTMPAEDIWLRRHREGRLASTGDLKPPPPPPEQPDPPLAIAAPLKQIEHQTEDEGKPPTDDMPF